MLRALGPSLGLLAQQLPLLLDDPVHRILAKLQPGILAQQGHVLPVALKTGNTRRYILCTKRSSRTQQHHKECVSEHFTHHYLHHLIKNHWINPNISRRPSNINSVLDTLTAAGSPE